jgi:putative hydroxymethylpyrimidine transport system permease protein
VATASERDHERRAAAGGALAGRPRATPGAATSASSASRRIAGGAARVIVSLGVLVLLWQGAVLVLAPPPFMLPSPLAVVEAARANANRLAFDAAITLGEILIGLVTGIAFGIATGILMAAAPVVGRALTPVLLVSQALPVFAIAPLLVLWLGFGLASKIVMATIIIYFPVASALADGLRRTDPGLLDIAALARAGRVRTLVTIRLPAAMPSLATGIRVAAVFAPIGAIIGEWVGASHGLGLLMVEANARMRTDLLFAALAVLAVATLVLRAVVDDVTRRLIPWADEVD